MKNIIFKLLITFNFSLITYNVSIAQTKADTLPTLDEVDIIKAYEPILISSNKVPFSPSLPDIAKAKPDPQTYSYNDVKGKIAYQPEDIRPIRVGQKKAEKNQFIYAKIGFGYPLAALAKIIITNPVQTKYKAGLDADFLFSKNNKPKFQQFTDLKIKGFGEAYIKKMAAVGGEFYYQLGQYNYYGYSDVILNRDSLKTNFNRFGGKVNIRNINDADYMYKLDVDFASVINKNVYHKPKELTIAVNAEFNYNFKKNYWAGAKLNVTNVSYNDNYKDTINTALNKQNHLSLNVTPYFQIKYKIWKLMLGPNIVITNRNVYILPEFHNVLSIYKDYFVMYNEWTNQVKINSLNNLSIENPFVNTRNYTNSLDEKRTFIGLRGSVKGFGYDVNFSQLVSHSNSQFVTNFDSTTLVNEPMFDVHTIYKLKAWNPHITLSYNKGSQFGAKVWFDYFVYNKNTAVELSYIPSIKAGFSAFYNWKDKLLVNIDIEGRSKVNAVQNQTGAVIPFVRSVVPIKGLIDINLSANYFITKNIGVFVDVNNVAFQKWQRYYNYPTYQFQVIAGAKLSF